MVNYDNFEQTTLPHRTVLYNYAFYITRNSDDANDLLQETLLKAYRFWHIFEEGTNIKAWLYQIMKNSYINCYRRKTREPEKVEYQEYHLPFNTIQETSSAHKYVMEKTYNEIFGDEITCSLESLSDSFKHILILSDIDGLSYEEIANMIGCPIGTVRSRLHRGRKILREILFAYATENGYISKE